MGFRPGAQDLAAVMGPGRVAGLARERRGSGISASGSRRASRAFSGSGSQVPRDRTWAPRHPAVIVEGVNAEALALALESRGAPPGFSLRGRQRASFGRAPSVRLRLRAGELEGVPVSGAGGNGDSRRTRARRRFSRAG